MELIFLNLVHMRDTHNDFQLPSTKTEIVVKLGQFNPPETHPWGRGDRGREVKGGVANFSMTVKIRAKGLEGHRI